MITWHTALFLCFCVVVMAVDISGHFIAPEAIPIKWLELCGWVFFMLALIAWEVARR